MTRLIFRQVSRVVPFFSSFVLSVTRLQADRWRASLPLGPTTTNTRPWLSTVLRVHVGARTICSDLTVVMDSFCLFYFLRFQFVLRNIENMIPTVRSLNCSSFHQWSIGEIIQGGFAGDVKYPFNSDTGYLKLISSTFWWRGKLIKVTKSYKEF